MPSDRAIFQDVQVLIVDDNLHIRELLKQCLRGFSFTNILETENATDAARHVDSKSLDLVLVDHLLGNELGTDLVRHIRQSKESRNPYVPIIMITGFADKHRLDEAVKSGVNYVVAKPIRPKDIYDRIWKCIYEPHQFLKTACYSGPDHPYLYRIGAICDPLQGRCDECPIYRGERPEEEDDELAMIV